VIDQDISTRAARATAQTIEDVCQLTEPELGGSTAAARVLREANRWLRFGGHGSPR
jgi:hypothetical protein